MREGWTSRTVALGGILPVVAVASLLAGAAACVKEEVRTTAPAAPTVAVVELPPAALGSAPTPPPTATETIAPPSREALDASPPSTSGRRCGPDCMGDDLCWIYEHRRAANRPDGGWPTASPFDDDDDAGLVRREARCRPASDRCPPGVHTQSSRVTIQNGVMSRWNTCVFYDAP